MRMFDSVLAVVMFSLAWVFIVTGMPARVGLYAYFAIALCIINGSIMFYMAFKGFTNRIK